MVLQTLFNNALNLGKIYKDYFLAIVVMFKKRAWIMAIVLILLNSTFLLADHQLTIGSVGCPIGASNHCVENAYCPSSDFYDGTTRIARQTVCTEKLINYRRCNADEPADRRDQQCLGILRNPNLPFSATTNPVDLQSRCLPAETDQRGNNPQLIAGQYYCLPIYRGPTLFPSYDGQQCYNQEQCSNGICDRKADFEDKKICQRALISSANHLGGVAPDVTIRGACFFDRQCFGYDPQSSADACAGEDRAVVPYSPGVCRLRQGQPQIGFTIRSDLWGNIDGTPAAADATRISVYRGETIELNWNVMADTVNSGPVSCTGISNPPGLWPNSLQNWEDRSFAPYPLLWRPETPISQRIGPITQDTSFTFSCTNRESSTPISKTVQVTLRPVSPPACSGNENNCLLAHLDFERPEINGESAGRQIFPGGPESSCRFPQVCTRNRLGEYLPGRLQGNPTLIPSIDSNQPGPRFYQLDGVDDVVSLPLDIRDPVFSNGVTVSFWVKPGSNRNEDLLVWADSIGGRILNILLNPSSGGQIMTVSAGGLGGIILSPFYGSRWNQVVFSIQPQSNQQTLTYRVYINGHLKFEGTQSNILFQTGKMLLFGGVRDFLNIPPFTGSIDEIKIFREALPMRQIANLYRTDALQNHNYWRGCLGKVPSSQLCTIEVNGANLDDRIVTNLLDNQGQCPATVGSRNLCHAYCLPGYVVQPGNSIGESRCVPEGQQDLAPPTITSQQATDITSTSATLRVITNEPATCRYDRIDGGSYNSLINPFATTGGTSHSSVINGLEPQGYIYFFNCRDNFGNVRAQNYQISFVIPVETTPMLYYCSSDRNEPNQANNPPAGGVGLRYSGYNTQIRGTSNMVDGISQTDVCESATALREFYCWSANGRYINPDSAAAGLLRSEVVNCNCLEGACVSAPPPAAACGDIDANGIINIADINRLIAHVVNRQPLTADERLRANVDGAGEITFGDIFRLIDKVINPLTSLVCS